MKMCQYRVNKFLRYSVQHLIYVHFMFKCVCLILAAVVVDLLHWP